MQKSEVEGNGKTSLRGKIKTCLLFIVVAAIYIIWWNGMNSIRPDVTVTLVSRYRDSFEYGESISIDKKKFISKDDISISSNFHGITVDQVYEHIIMKHDIENENDRSYPALGEYSITFSADRDIRKKADVSLVNGKYRIQVADTTKPEVSILQSEISVEYGSALTDETVKKCFSVSDLTETAVSYDLSKIDTAKSGKQNLEIEVRDTSSNTEKFTLTVYVKDRPAVTVSKGNSTSSGSSSKSYSYDSGVFQLDGNVGYSYIQQAQKEWNRIPAHIRNGLISSGWQFILTAYEIQGRYYHGPVKGTIAGLTKTGSKTIYIKARGNATKRAVCHEVGHAFDSLVGYVSNTSEFGDIYEQEKYTFKEYDSIGDGHNISSQNEYFAEAFKTYCYSPSVLKQTAPRTYVYLMRYI